MDIPYGAYVLEIGCGDGVIMNEIATLRPDIFFYGIDISEKMIIKAEKMNPKFIFSANNILDGIPFDKKFDCIFSFSVGQYLLEKDLIDISLMSLMKLTNQGKVYHLSIPNDERKLSKLINDKLDTYSPLIALVIGTYLFLINRKNKYYKDGSYWHSVLRLRNKLLVKRKDITVEVEKSLISWFRFDFMIKVMGNISK